MPRSHNPTAGEVLTGPDGLVENYFQQISVNAQKFLLRCRTGRPHKGFQSWGNTKYLNDTRKLMSQSALDFTRKTSIIDLYNNNLCVSTVGHLIILMT